MEKHDTGWWWGNLKGELGWVPSTYLEKKKVQKYAKQPSPQMQAHRSSLLGKKPKRCTSSGPFRGQTKDILSFKAGECFDILEKSETGWWFLKNASGQEGWAPEDLLVEGQDLKPSRPAPMSPTKPSATSKFPLNPATDSKPSLPLNKSFNGDLKAQLKPVAPFKPTQPDKPVLQNKPTQPDKPVLQNKPARQDSATKPTQNNLKPAMPTKPSSYAKVKIESGGADTSKPVPPGKPRPTISESRSTGNLIGGELSGVLAKRLQTSYQPATPSKPGRPVSQDMGGFKPVLQSHSKMSEPTKPVLPSRPSRPTATPSVATKSSSSYVTTDDNRAYDEGCLSFRKGESAELVEKGKDGWWWMKIRNDEGWVLDSKVKLQSDRAVAKKTGPVALSDFKAEHEGSISVRQGDTLQILEEDSGSGWTWVRAGSEEGWVPTDLIKSS